MGTQPVAVKENFISRVRKMRRKSQAGILPEHDVEQVHQVRWFEEPFNCKQLYAHYLNSEEGKGKAEKEERDSHSFSQEAIQITDRCPEMTNFFDEIDLSDDITDQSAKAKQRVPISSSVKDPNSSTQVQKATLVKILNEDTKLSHDRLTRVRQRQEYSSKSTDQHASNEDAIGLFQDYVVLDRPNKTFQLVNILRMVCGRQEYKRPVSYTDANASQITLHGYVYEKILKYCSDAAGSVEFTKGGQQQNLVR